LVLDLSCAEKDGLCWSLVLPAGIPFGDSPRDERFSPLRLFENGLELGPPHTLHSEIRVQGGGRFSHWGHSLYFSTSDGSDPCRNRRVYTISDHGGAITADTAIANAAGYQLVLAETYLDLMRHRGIDPVGARVLEIGPGENLGAQILLACAGVQMTVADRFLSPWRPEHAELYQSLARSRPEIAEAIDGVLARRNVDGLIRAVREPAAAMPSLASGSFDVVLSNAVLEHAGDLAQIAAELKRISAPGAWHFHQIDFRDHDDMSRPLEHLLIPRAEFLALSERDSRRGFQMRLSEARAAFEAAGFTLVEEEINTVADPDYLAEFLPRLRCSGSDYRAWPDSDLAALGARLILVA
jgi:SAM-dependent methyltransferase